MGQNDPFKWSLRFPPNLVSLHLRYVPPQPGQLRPLETIDHHGHGLASGWNPEFQDSITGSVVEAFQNNCCIHQSYIWSPLETFLLVVLGGNSEQYNPMYMYIFFIFHFSLKQYLYSFGVTKNPYDASAPTNRSKKELTPVILSSETHLSKKPILKGDKPVSFLIPFDGFVVATLQNTMWCNKKNLILPLK